MSNKILFPIFLCLIADPIAAIQICNKSDGAINLVIAAEREQEPGVAIVWGWSELAENDCEDPLFLYKLRPKRLFVSAEGITKSVDQEGVGKIKLLSGEYGFCVQRFKNFAMLGERIRRDSPPNCENIDQTQWFGMLNLEARDARFAIYCNEPRVNDRAKTYTIHCSIASMDTAGHDPKPPGIRRDTLPPPPPPPPPPAQWTADCLCKRGNAWVGHFNQNPIGNPPTVGSTLTLYASGKVCNPSSCDDGVSITSGSQKIRVTRTFMSSPGSMIYTFALYGDAIP